MNCNFCTSSTIYSKFQFLQVWIVENFKEIYQVNLYTKFLRSKLIHTSTEQINLVFSHFAMFILQDIEHIIAVLLWQRQACTLKPTNTIWSNKETNINQSSLPMISPRLQLLIIMWIRLQDERRYFVLICSEIQNRYLIIVSSVH